MKNTLKTTLLFIFTILCIVLVLVFGLAIAVLQIPRHMILKSLTLNQYFSSVILGADSFGGSLIYGRRGAYFYISSIAYYDATVHNKNIWLMKTIDTIFFFDKEHCKTSFMNEVKRINKVPELDEDGNLKVWDKKCAE